MTGGGQGAAAQPSSVFHAEDRDVSSGVNPDNVGSLGYFFGHGSILWLLISRISQKWEATLPD